MIAFNSGNKVTVARAGGIEVAVVAMKVHPRNEHFQHYGFMALTSIAFNSHNQVTVARVGGIEVVVAAMKAW